jgi:hypothetical protein
MFIPSSRKSIFCGAPANLNTRVVKSRCDIKSVQRCEDEGGDLVFGLESSFSDGPGPKTRQEPSRAQIALAATIFKLVLISTPD